MSWEIDSEKKGWLSLARRIQPRGLLSGVTHVGGGADGKVTIERLCIFLLYVETSNSKVIKGFVPELRSRYVFFVFRDSYVLCIYVTNILCTFRISVSWVCHNVTVFFHIKMFSRGIILYTQTHTHTHTHTYIYICVCVCLCVYR